MPDRHDYVALHWVKAEVVDTLDGVRQALDALARRPFSGEALQSCLEGLHQVHGSLLMVEFYGAALLAEEIEQLALALAGGRVEQPEQALKWLRQAVEQLPLYLDRVETARRDLPLVVLPLINDLRSARGQPLLAETSLFSPLVSTPAPLPGEVLAQRDAADLGEQLRKLRHALQAALLGLLRDEDETGHLAQMAKVFARLELLSEGAPLEPLWQVAAALVEGMAQAALPSSPALLSLLKNTDKQLKRLLDDGIVALNRPAPPALLKSLLFYIAKAQAASPRMHVLRERYDLLEALPDSGAIDAERAHLDGPGPDALRSVLTALCEELVRVKEQLGLFVSSDRQHADDLASLMPPLRQIADTLAVLGFGQPRKVISDQLAVIQGLALGSREPNDAVLMDVAGALLYVEATLAGMAGLGEPSSAEDSRLPTTDLNLIHQRVLHETRQGLQHVRDLLMESLEAGTTPAVAQQLPPLLDQLRGALQMIPLHRAATVLQACNDAVLRHWSGRAEAPLRPLLDALADALTGVDYYLERLGADHEGPADHLLDYAEAALAELGYRPAEVDVPLLDQPLTPTELLVLSDLQTLDSPEVVQALAQVLANPVTPLNPPAQHAPASLLPPPPDEPAVDAELREVFLEECAEVLAELREYWPRWRAEPDHATAPTQLRRGFHTLKGSGRMVRALVLGELAWAAENLLNRVLELSIRSHPQTVGLVERIIERLPALIEEFALGQQRQHDDVDLLAADAHAHARGQAGAAPSPDPERLDPQLLEIFQNEASAHLTSLNRFLVGKGEGVAMTVSDELQRALHTLKGSALVAGVLPMAELALPLDLLAREFRAHRFELHEEELQLLESAEYLLRQKLRDLPDDPLAPVPGAPALIAQIHARVNARLQAVDTQAVPTLRRHDPQLISDFMAHGMDILLDAESLLLRWQAHPGERQELATLLDELTTLGEGAQHAELHAMDDLCEALLDLYGAVEESSVAASPAFFAEAGKAHEGLLGMLDQLAAGQQVQPQPQRILALRQLLEQGLDPSDVGVVARDGSSVRSLDAPPVPSGVDPDDEIVQLFLEEAADVLDGADHALQRWLVEPDNPAPLAPLQRELHTFKGGARLAGIGPIGDLGHELEALYQGLVEGRFVHSSALEHLLIECHRRLGMMLEQLQHQQPMDEPTDLLAALLNWREQMAVTSASAGGDDADADAELLDVFLEEGLDIVESVAAALQRWQAEPGNRLEVENLLRDLHTLKGGARMVEIGPLGDLAHEMEFLYEQVSAGHVQPSAALFTLLQKGHDRLAQMLDAMRSKLALPGADKLIAAIRSFGVAAPEPATDALKSGPVAEPAAVERGAVDVVKVSADLLDDLGNLAGETSIFRGRIEQQVNDTQAALQEMETTIERMRDQLRRLDTETQGRILSRHQVDHDEEFDPLEMDRHSQLQQLSRALFESASDLLDIRETLSSRNHESQALLKQQARVNTQLHEGLMRTRMVPFERLLPRLQRVVRQVADELGKEVDFDVTDAHGEMDRSVLERMVAPLEHMLRNAVDHGLEPAQARLAAGKPVHGRIRLALLHEGGDVVIEMSDDGAGVPLDAVRAKAIKRGLIEPGNDLSDHDVLQFILQPGFSTATKVTQISGRGLGMDVVHEEVKQLGGSMSIDSRAGQGARFQIRLPFTVSVNRALMVQCGEELYAIPMNSIEGIVRVPHSELHAAYQHLPSRYHFAERRYDLRYLGELLQQPLRPNLTGQGQPLPVLLVRSFDHQVAVQVDSLAGSREIVVKSLGPQLAGVPGLAGATILGDGSVVLILDLLAQIRASQARQFSAQSQPGQAMAPGGEVSTTRPLLVLVVDDSVTVRKVTSRLLERHGMQVITAKDGFDAMALLEEQMPDVLLLDIEMPRMDGFEVAAQIRGDERLMALPIIMITSRSGQKHRDRAMALGVNDYLGKPYQETRLLESIRHWSRPHA